MEIVGAPTILTAARELENDVLVRVQARRRRRHDVLPLVGQLVDHLAYVGEQLLQRRPAVAVGVGAAFDRAGDRIAQGAAQAGHARNLHFGRLGLVIDRGEKRGALEVQFGEQRLRRGRDRLQQVDGETIARRLSKAHLFGARIDLAHHAAAVAGVGDEQDACAAQFDLLDEVVELGSEDSFQRACRRDLRTRAGETRPPCRPDATPSRALAPACHARRA